MPAPRDRDAVAPLVLRWTPTEQDERATWRHLHGPRRIRTLLAYGLSGVVVALLLVLGASVPSGLGWLVVVGWTVWGIRVAWARPVHLAGGPPITLTVGTTSLVLERTGLRSEIDWRTIGEIESTGRQVLLHRSGGDEIAIPRRALDDRSAVAAFVARCHDAVQSSRTGPDPVADPSEPEAGRDHYVIRYRLGVDDHRLFSRVIHAQQIQRRTLGWTLLGVLTAGVLLASLEPWRSPPDPGLTLLMVLFAGLLVAMGLAPRWIPRVLIPWPPQGIPLGAVVLGVGPAGGWMHSGTGVVRFGWGAIRRVHSDADQLLLLFSDRRGVVVPGRAFVPQSDQDRLAADIQRWRAVAAPRPIPHEAEVGPGAFGPRSEAHAQMPGPFAPPDGRDPR